MNDQEAFQTIIGVIASIWAACIIPSLAISVVVLIAKWKLFEKSGEEGWAAIIPFYCDYVLYKITWGEGLYFLFKLIPIVSVVFHILTMIKLSKAFGKGGGFACGLIFLYPIFFCILGLDKNYAYCGIPCSDGTYRENCNKQQEYQNPYGQANQQSTYQNPYSNNNQNAENRQQQSQYNSQYYYQKTTSQAAPKFCCGCGTALEGEPKFCPHCGRQL